MVALDAVPFIIGRLVFIIIVFAAAAAAAGGVGAAAAGVLFSLLFVSEFFCFAIFFALPFGAWLSDDDAVVRAVIVGG